MNRTKGASRRGNRSGRKRLTYPAGTPLRTIQAVLSFDDWRIACDVGGSMGKAAGGVRELIRREAERRRLAATIAQVATGGAS